MKTLLLLSACLISASAQAWDCKYEKKIEQELELSGSEELVVKAAAGELEINGVKGGSSAAIRGRICVSEEEWLDESGVETSAGKTAEISVELPDTDGAWSLLDRRYAYLDLVLEVPDDIPLNIHDSSGDIEIEGVGEVVVKDSSGDTEITDVRHSVVVSDSSGDIVIRDVGGDVTIESDSSGDIRGTDIEGAVLVRSDSSGDIRFSDVGGNFVVEKDSSGDIVANTIGGDFLVERDGSGDIQANNVKGTVTTPEG